MEAALHEVARYVALTAEAIAILLVAIGIVEAIVAVARQAVGRGGSSNRRRVYLDFSHWLVAALTFQLASDIVSTSFSPSWDEVGRLAVVAAIRTFLSYFLDREVENTRRLQEAAAARRES
jgi:uncharacterized membrane protein